MSYISTTQYTTLTTSKFISLDPASGDWYHHHIIIIIITIIIIIIIMISIEVPTSVDSVFQADDEGYWSTSSNFKFSKSLYSLRANSLKVTTSQWKTVTVIIIIIIFIIVVIIIIIIDRRWMLLQRPCKRFQPKRSFETMDGIW